MTVEHGPPWQWEPARRLEGVANEVALDWGIELGPRYEWARFSFAAPAGLDAVLKITPVEDDEADQEADALAFWNGRGAVRLLREDRTRRAMLIERCVPGHDASAIDDVEAVRVALATARELWRPVDDPVFRRAGDEMARWLKRLAERTDHPYVAVAAKLFASIRPRHDVLVHGDYHHHNLLRHTGRWLAIDPKPLIAEPEFDVVTLLWNPLDLTVTRDVVEQRMRQFASAGLDERRLRDWAVIRGTQLGLPLEPGDDASTVRQLSVVGYLLE